MPKRKQPPTMEVESFPGRLDAVMKWRRVENFQLSADSGIDDSQISRYRNRQQFEGVSLDTVVRLARSLGVRAGWLGAGEGDDPWVQAGALPALVVQGQAALSELRRRELANAVDLGPTEVDIARHRKNQRQGVAAGAAPKHPRSISVAKRK